MSVEMLWTISSTKFLYIYAINLDMIFSSFLHFILTGNSQQIFDTTSFYLYAGLKDLFIIFSQCILIYASYSLGNNYITLYITFN